MSSSLTDYFISDKSLVVSMSTITESPVGLLWLVTTDFIIDTTIRGGMNLCVVQCRCFIDLLANQIECVHDFAPEE